MCAHAYRERKRKVPFVRYYFGNSNLGIMLLYKSDRKLPDFLLVPQYPRLKILSKKLLDVLLHKLESTISRYVRSVRILQRKIIKL